MANPNHNIFGPMKHGGMVEDAVIAFMREWLPTYLAEINRRVHLIPGTIHAPRSYSTYNQFGPRWPESNLPAVMVIAPDEDIFNKNGDGSFDIAYSCGIGAVVQAGSQREALRLAKLYMAAVRNLIVQNSTLGKRVQQSHWVSGTTDRVPTQSERTLAGFEATFQVILSNAVSNRYGPPTAITPNQPVPAPDPTVDPGESPRIMTADVTIKLGQVNAKPVTLLWDIDT